MDTIVCLSQKNSRILWLMSQQRISVDNSAVTMLLIIRSAVLCCRIVERMGAAAITGQLRHLCDLLIVEASLNSPIASSASAGGPAASQPQPQASPQSSFSRIIEALAELLFRRALVPIDRFLLTLLLRNYEGVSNELIWKFNKIVRVIFCVLSLCYIYEIE